MIILIIMNFLKVLLKNYKNLNDQQKKNIIELLNIPEKIKIVEKEKIIYKEKIILNLNAIIMMIINKFLRISIIFGINYIRFSFSYVY